MTDIRQNGAGRAQGLRQWVGMGEALRRALAGSDAVAGPLPGIVRAWAGGICIASG